MSRYLRGKKRPHTDVRIHVFPKASEAFHRIKRQGGEEWARLVWIGQHGTTSYRDRGYAFQAHHRPSQRAPHALASTSQALLPAQGQNVQHLLHEDACSQLALALTTQHQEVQRKAAHAAAEQERASAWSSSNAAEVASTVHLLASVADLHPIPFGMTPDSPQVVHWIPPCRELAERILSNSSRVGGITTKEA